MLLCVVVELEEDVVDKDEGQDVDDVLVVEVQIRVVVGDCWRTCCLSKSVVICLNLMLG